MIRVSICESFISSLILNLFIRQTNPDISEEKIKDKIEGILQKHSIYYEYEEDTGVFTAFGYK